MRRVVGLTLTGLGAFFVASALLLRFYLPGQVLKFPLNEYIVYTATGNNFSYFSLAQVKELSGVSMRGINTIRGVVDAGSSSTAVWDEFAALEDVTNHQPVEYTFQRSAFDRRTGVVVNCCGGAIGSNTKVRQSGQGFVWPIGTQQKTYQVFDPVLLRAMPFRYAGTATIAGMAAYKFVEHVSNQRFSQQTLPRSLAGLKGQGSVTLPEYYTATNTYWIDPVTGVVLAVTKDSRAALEDSTGATRLIVLQGKLTTTPQSNQGAVNTASSGQSKINLVQNIGPLVLVIIGIGLVVLGIVLIARQRDEDEPAYDQDPVGSEA
jgi:hypothetical protein